MNVTVNENPVSVPQEVATWGQLIDWLETKVLNAGECITEVRVDGQEEVDYRNTANTGQDLELVGPIRIESGKFDAVLHESLSELETELDRALQSAAKVISLMEARNEREGYGELAKLLDSIRIFFAITSEDLGWVEPNSAEIKRPAIPGMLQRALNQVISAQENQSWLLLCDIIQYEIIPILESWKGIVQSTKAAA